MDSKKRKWPIVLAVAAIILCLCILSAYLVFHHYAGLMKRPSQGTAAVIQETIEPETEETVAGTDTDEEDIRALEEQLRANLENDAEELKFDKNVHHILLIGTDTRENDSSGRSDSIILMSINRKTRQIVLTSIMRDIYVSIPGVGNNRINTAHAYGGPDLLLKTVNENFKLKVDDYIRVNFYAFMDVIDEIGGVLIDVDADEQQIMNNYIQDINDTMGILDNEELLSPADVGLLRLNGKQALAYSRVRYVKGSDFRRTERQREVLMQVFEEMKKLNLLEMHNVLETLLPEIATNLDEGELLNLLLGAPDYLGYELISFRIPVNGGYENITIDSKSMLGIDIEKNRNALIETIYGDK
ncbi:LCP family protein [Lachnotalea sp. AF33-28]|uniref:LCP family protein n=1 Tax=Lachnotalea sp. AF33-28 TaxID=2292046 RepID=UPI000E54BFB0|nr:LCP family protein [Lachnotalea sp. AF33-28]RHP29447.1 hypothetical protein DWZ56_21455 [Lachnotalea sp. AF33-28]